MTSGATAATGTAGGTAAWSVLGSPVGELLLATDGRGLMAVYFERHRAGDDRRPGIARGPRGPDDDHPVLAAARRELTEYFARRRRGFEVPLAPQGTDFQQRVWRALLDIPYGETTSYGEIARRLGLPPGASRAVGLANGANPISIIIPCHRVVGVDGSLTGYGGGLGRKRFLLDLEAEMLF